MTLSAMLVSTLTRHGFSALIERQSVSGGEFGSAAPTWSPVATVDALWDNPRRMVKGVNDGGQASMSQRYMTIAYRADLKDPAGAVGLRVTVNGVRHSVLGIGEIGEQVGLRLLLDSGTEQ